MPKVSAGLLMYRLRGAPRRGAPGVLEPEFLLVHPGGPFWAKKDAGAWFIPKGEVMPGEEPFHAACREFQEETGLYPPLPDSGGQNLVPLGSIRPKSGKRVYAWAFEGGCDPGAIRSNTFEIEWPPRSGQRREFPEIDRAAFFPFDSARAKIHAAELPFLERLAEQIRKPAAQSRAASLATSSRSSAPRC